MAASRPEPERQRTTAHRETAFDHRDRLQPVTGWSDEDLQQLPIYRGETFEEGEVYFNLNLPEVGAFRATRSDRPVKGYLYVAKGEVADNLWLRLIDSWGTDLPMGAQSPHPGAFGHEPTAPPEQGGEAPREEAA